MRLIDADALVMEIVNTASEASHKAWEIGTHTYIDTLNRLAERQHEIIDMIHDAPTVNPEDSRPHVRWITHNNGITECSECHTLGSPQWKCCPVCTAMMEGKENENGIH